jgi:hypothetical protein
MGSNATVSCVEDCFDDDAADDDAVFLQLGGVLADGLWI